MSGQDRARLETLWDEARALPDAQRQQFLDTINDAALRDELASLLLRAERAERFFGRFSAVVHEAGEAAARAGAAEIIAVATSPSRQTATSDVVDPLIGHTIAHYRIETRLGEGGMGVVYRALDTRLQRAVALKFLPPELNADPGAKQRFLVEARAAAALDHPNICNIHEIAGDDETRPFIAMAFYSGQTLRQVLQQGPLPLPLALSYAIQIARGLSAAHERGIVHGDVKPGNVVITAAGVVKLLDFGIARTPDATASDNGMLSGTIAYMAPEQVTSRVIDARTDLWSLGIVLYEMWTGVRPFDCGDPTDTLRAILHEHPVQPSIVRSGSPPQIDQIARRLLEKNVDDRYASADELIGALADAMERVAPKREAGNRRVRRRVALTIAALGVAGVAWFAASFGGDHEPTRILVSDAAGDSAAGSTVSERLRNSLASPRLTVVGRPALAGVLMRMGRVTGERLSPEIVREIAIREGFNSYVHVTVDRIRDAFTLGAILVEAESENFIDSHRETARNETELMAAADRLAAGIRRMLGRSLNAMPATEPLLAVTTDSVSALQRHLEAVQANRDGDFPLGVELLDEAIAIDPQFADALVVRGFALEQMGQRAGRAQASVTRAFELRDRLTRPEKYSVEADYAWHVQGDLGKAISALRRSHDAFAEIAPGRVLNRRSYGLALMLSGDIAEAGKVLQEGRIGAPCPATKTHLVSVLYALHRKDEARAVLHEAIEQWPTNPFLGMDQAHFFAADGAYRRAHDAVQRLHRGFTLPYALRAEAAFDAVEGRHDEALQHLRELRENRLEQRMLVPALEVTAAMGRLLMVARDTAAALQNVADFLERHPLASLPAAERPYLSLALFFADARNAQRARQLLTDYDTLVPAELKGPDRWMYHRVRASLFMAVDSPLLALDELTLARSSDRIWSEWFDNLLFTIDQRPELARVFDRLGQPDSAIAVLERYVAAPVLYRAEMDAFHLAAALRQLAQLYETRSPERAARYDSQLTELWREADPAVKAAWRLNEQPNRRSTDGGALNKELRSRLRPLARKND